MSAHFIYSLKNYQVSSLKKIHAEEQNAEVKANFIFIIIMILSQQNSRGFIIFFSASQHAKNLTQSNREPSVALIFDKKYALLQRTAGL